MFVQNPRRGALLTLGAATVLGLGVAVPLASATPDVATKAKPTDDVTAKIVGGHEAKEGAWPYATKVRMKASDGTYGCGGTMISPDILLTAQHCLDKSNKEIQVEIYVGKVEWKQGEHHKVVDWKTGQGPKKGDWAVAKLDSPITSTKEFAQLPKDGSADKADQYTAFGWGTTSQGGQSSPKLLEINDLPLHTGSQCKSTSDLELCTGGNGEGGKDTCQGDSGGPLFSKDAQGHWVQVGITSWGIGCARPDRAGHYAKVSAFLDPIMKSIEELGGTKPGQNPPAPTPTPAPTTPAPTPAPTTPAPTPAPTTPAPTPAPTTPAPTPSPGGGVVNGDFEKGMNGWSGSAGIVDNSGAKAAHSGDSVLWLGGEGGMGQETFAQQDVTVPADGEVSWWLDVHSTEAPYQAIDKMQVQAIDKATGKVTVLAKADNRDRSAGFRQQTVRFPAELAGKAVTLKFTATEDKARETSFVVDDVVVK